jgi:hypothetical protein
MVDAPTLADYISQMPIVAGARALAAHVPAAYNQPVATAPISPGGLIGVASDPPLTAVQKMYAQPVVTAPISPGGLIGASSDPLPTTAPAAATSATAAPVAVSSPVAQPARVVASQSQPGMTAQEWARQNIGKVTPYQLQLQRAMAAPLVSPQNQIMHQMMLDENAEYAQRAADYRAGKPVLGGADGKTVLGPHDILNEHQVATGNILRANPMYNLGAAGMVTSPTGQ